MGATFFVRGFCYALFLFLERKTGMKRRTNLFKLLATIIALISVASIFTACNNGNEQSTNENEISSNITEESIEGKKIYYNDDGTVNYEEEYYQNGILKTKICYYYDQYNIVSKIETHYSEAGKKVKEIVYYGLTRVEEEYDERENIIRAVCINAKDESVVSRTEFEYDNNDNMVKESLYYGTNDTAEKYTEFAYNEKGALIKESIFYNSGKKELYVYYVEESAGKHEHQFSDYSPQNYIYTITAVYRINESKGISNYDCSKIISADIYNDDGSISKELKRVYKDTGDYVINEIVYDADGSVKIEKAYDINANVVKTIVYLNGEVKSHFEYEFNEFGKHKKVFRYDALGSLVDYTEYEYDMTGKSTSSKTYDAFGEMTEYGEYTYDEKGDKVSNTNYYINGKIKSCYEFYENGATKKATYYDVDGSGYGTEYNIEGKAIKDWYYETDGSSYCEEADNKGNVVKTTLYDPDGKVSGIIANEFNADGKNIKTIFYTAEGKVKYSYVFEYNSDGELLKRTKYDADGNEILVGKHTTYNEDGSINSIINYDDNGNIITTESYEYDKFGRIIKKIMTNKNDPDSDSTIEYEYNEFGQVVKKTETHKNNSNVTEYWDNGNMKKITAYHSSGTIMFEVEFDEAGKEIKRSYYNPDGSVIPQ